MTVMIRSLKQAGRGRHKARLIAWCVLLCWYPSFSALAQRHAAQASAETASDLQARIRTHISQPRFSAATWGVKIVQLENGKLFFEHNAAKLMKPASNAKLYTGALALDRLGPECQIKTSLYARAQLDSAGILKSDLIVYGRGDPSLAARFNDGNYQKSIEPLVEALASAGVKRIEGNLVGDESYFRGPPFGAGWTWDDLQYYYGAEVSALTVEDNVLDIVVKPGSAIGDPCQLAINPATSFLHFINQTQTVPKETGRRVDVYRPVGSNTAYLSGHLPVGGSNHIDAVAVPRPADFFVSLLRDALEKRSIKVTGELRSVNWIDRETEIVEPSELIELASVSSRPLREILPKMLKPSQNLYAQLLLLQVGAASEMPKKAGGTQDRSVDSSLRSRSNSSVLTSDAPRTSEELGLAEMKNFLKEAGVKNGDVLLEEGSGLSRACLVTPNATVELLRFMNRHKHAEMFRDALPVAAVDGTLRSRMKETKAARNVQAKTGRLRYVDTLSGYVTTAGGEQLAFSIMLNNYAGAANSGRDAIDALAVMLAEFKGKISKPEMNRNSKSRR
jgi:D-alanyl-D-alanine carboxypeptidase/D-alanyl-D-alanine-endopeptidase (penicillin-binding protein 4)